MQWAWLRRLFERPVTEEVVAAVEDLPAVNEGLEECPPVMSPVPSFIKRVAAAGGMSDALFSEDSNTGDHPCRDPRRALTGLSGGATGSGAGGSEGSRAEADPAQPVSSGLGILGEVEARSLVEGLASLEYRHGDEHDTFFDPATRRVIKLTVPGGFGAKGGLEEYLQRMAWVNELFHDDWLFEGWVQFPNEALPRMVTSQPWYRVKPARPSPTLEEIDAYMWKANFLKAYDGAWIHRDREIMASDALPKNFVLDVAGFVQPIDVILLAPNESQWERLQHMVHNQPQA